MILLELKDINDLNNVCIEINKNNDLAGVYGCFEVINGEENCFYIGKSDSIRERLLDVFDANMYIFEKSKKSILSDNKVLVKLLVRVLKNNGTFQGVDNLSEVVVKTNKKSVFIL